MAAAGLYRGYNYVVLTQAQVDAIDAASPTVEYQALSRVFDQALDIESGDLANNAVTTAAIAANAVTSAKLDVSTIQYAEVALTKANLLAMNATPVTVIAAPGSGKVIEFISAVVIYDFDTAAYGGGGDVTFKYNGAATVSNTVSAANSFGAAGDKITMCEALDTANGIAMSVNTALVITNATGAFTDPGTAAGVGRIKIAYRIHSTGL